MITHQTQLRPLVAARNPARWIYRHQLLSFFLLTFLFSWSIFVAGASIPFLNPTTYSRMILIGAYGPALAALLISRVTNPKTNGISAGKWLLIFLGVLALAMESEWIDHIWWGHNIDLSLLGMDVMLVILAALVMTWLLTDRNRLRTGFRERLALGKSLPWILIVLGLWPAMVLISNVIAGLLGWPVSAEPVWPHKPFILIESFLWYALFGGPLNEEPGWRGFALPRLQNKFSPLLSSIILGALWGLWHVPLHFLAIYGGGAFGALIRFMDIPRAILFTWVYNRTKGNLLICILFHAAVNTTSLFLPRSHYVVFILCFVVAGIVILGEKMWRRHPDIEQAHESA